MKIAGIQHDIVWEDPEANYARLRPLVLDAVENGAELVILTEMFAWGFSMKTERVREPVDGPSVQFLAELSAETGAWICGSLPEVPAGLDLPHNQLVLTGPQEQVHRYPKMYPFSYSGEHEHYTAGDKPVTVSIGDLRVSLFICYDLRFADEFWALAPDTDLYVVPANWPESRREHWMTLLHARAIENQAYVAGINRVGAAGREGTLPYSGDSLIYGPFGELLAQGEPGIESTLFADIDPGRVAEVRRDYPFLADRRS